MSCPSEVRELVQRLAREQDEAAWLELVKRYEVRLLVFLEKRLGDRTKCEDLFQNILIEVWQHIADIVFEEGRCFEGYLFWLAGVRTADELRKPGAKRIGKVAVVSIYDTYASGSQSLQQFEHKLKEKARNLSSFIISDEQRSREANVLVTILRAYTRRIREKGQSKKRRVFDLIFCKARGIKDTAARLGMSRDAVKQMKKRMCDDLKELARKHDPRHTLFPGLWN